jgi:hypothetical protein
VQLYKDVQTGKVFGLGSPISLNSKLNTSDALTRAQEEWASRPKHTVPKAPLFSPSRQQKVSPAAKLLELLRTKGMDDAESLKHLKKMRISSIEQLAATSISSLVSTGFTRREANILLELAAKLPPEDQDEACFPGTYEHQPRGTYLDDTSPREVQEYRTQMEIMESNKAYFRAHNSVELSIEANMYRQRPKVIYFCMAVTSIKLSEITLLCLSNHRLIFIGDYSGGPQVFTESAGTGSPRFPRGQRRPRDARDR